MTRAGGARDATRASSGSGAGSPAVPRVLSIAGTDPTGGAGIQADLKSIAAGGGYGMAVVTVLVAQNTRGVRSVHAPPASFVREQLDAVSDDVAVDAIKIGMLGDASTIDTVSRWLDETWPTGSAVRPPVVLDPVMIATSGDRLLAPEAEHALHDLVGQVDLVTPNLPELAVLAGQPVATTWADALDQGRRVSASTGTIVLVKGGHLDGDLSPDALVDAAGRLGGRDMVEVPGRRVATSNTHGTGCSLSSALATHFARSGDWVSALETSKRWLLGALDRSDELAVGHGAGPINHFAELWDAAGVTSGATTPGPATTEAWWNGIRDVRVAVDELDFVRDMRDGTLDRAVFEHYLEQDSIYLERYARALSRASQLAPTTDEQAFWAQSAAACLDVELELHRERLGGAVSTATPPHPATVAYTDHLLAVASGASYGVLVAAVLPCFWLYSDLGERLLAARHATHPYGEWLDTYADPAFAESTRRAREIADRAAVEAGSTERQAMWDAFRTSSWHEVAFFDMRL
ncbi:hydroxymethylpyrimidine/phosphomethylpyrimidine kinase [Frigoribacterium sp. PhB160]|uniref:bifunctional hydroxymethylpyrimidine kinase/phosphomethylpyrimidine kinase n=1 Tax=Frigoribacterium sp. PhB160 TaxID=2485192 RepID=UPI000FBB2EB4|nr:bifunctional hydroxymethylpyrimidine kinase/phosphomethylpyrimidine kinase [Frigoribacterium sp. PhB160]ROS58228.1 hydroxymethylpyrimidine/phosphomethylpyrimidine kinase [Frigoribacterium sp. PhB160]